jgi:prepilin-type N-terminal cleavage/methylation domain-containing protein
MNCMCARIITPAARRAGGTSGFSLIEVMCAMLILGIALVGLTQGLTVALHSTKESELQTTAALFAAGQIETVRAEGGLEDGEKEGECGEGLSLYRWKQTITGAGIDGLHQVTVTVENTKSSKLIYELQTMLFEAPDEPTLGAGDKRKTSGSATGRRGQ